jgi:succinoglycan biosynthesis transport protein ExoP
MTLAQLLRILLARRWLIASITILSFAAVLGISLTLPKTYVATSLLVADAKGTDPVSGNAVPSQTIATFINTQIDIIKSRNVAYKVVDRYKLSTDPQMQAQFQSSTEGLGNIRDWLADKLLGNLEVEPSRNSNVFALTYAASDPGLAAELANAFADAYIQTTIELKLEPARRQSHWFDEQLVGLRQTLEGAQRKLAEFQRTNALVNSDSRLDVEAARLNGIMTELVAAQTAMSDAQTRRAQMNQALGKGRVEELPDILGNGLLQSMKADLARADAKLSEVAERYGRNHPQYISAAAEVTTLRERFNAEVGTARGSINQKAEIAEQRAVEMQKALDEQKNRILQLKRVNDERDVLSRDMESAQRTYEAASQRSNMVRLESELDQSSVAVLTPATQPILPAKPRVLLNSAAAMVIGGMLALGLALGLELRDRRVRSVEDISSAFGIPVLAELPKAPRLSKRQHARITRAYLAGPEGSAA